MSAPSTPAQPVQIDQSDALAWFAEIVVEHHEQTLRWLALVAAAQRDWTELVKHLPAAALAGVPSRTYAEAVEALLEQLRADLAVEISGSTE